MARFGKETGEGGSFGVQVDGNGVIRGHFAPRDTPEHGTKAAERLAVGVKLLEVDPAKGRLSIYPTDTRPWSDGFLGPKYEKTTTIVLPADADSEWDIAVMLEGLPSGFTKDYEYGLVLARECEVLASLIQARTDCSRIEFVATGEPVVAGRTFCISFARFESIRAELTRIKNRGTWGFVASRRRMFITTLPRFSSWNHGS